MMPRKPTCLCGTCRTCYMRRARQRFYEREKAKLAREDQNARRRSLRRNICPEVSDEEMDRRALILMQRDSQRGVNR